MSEVQFAAMRRYVLDALAVLADSEHQERVWLSSKKEQGQYDELSLELAILYDDCAVLPEPRSRIGSVLIDGDEIARLEALGAALTDLIDRLGAAPDGVYIADPAWDEVVRLSSSALAAMIRAGGYE
jgi:hypothetical protein